MNDPIEMLREAKPRVDDLSSFVDHVRKDFMARITELGGQPETEMDASVESDHEGRGSSEVLQRRRGRRRWVAPLAGVVALGVAGTAAAASLGIFDPSDSTMTINVACENADFQRFIDAATGEVVEETGGVTIARSITGDPVADCEEVWRSLHGTEPPPMSAFENDQGGIVVVQDGAPVPGDWVALDSGIHQNTDLIELNAALADHGRGLWSNCYHEAGAREMVDGVFGHLGLSDWSVTVDVSRFEAGSCAGFFLVPEQKTVVLIGRGKDSPGFSDPYLPFSRGVSDRLEAECLDLKAAADLVRALAAETDVSSVTPVEFTEQAGLLDLTFVEDESAICTRATVEIGGAVSVTLRGPAG